MGLLDAFKQYIKDALPGGLLNPEVAQLPGLLNDQANLTAQAIKAKGQSFKRGLDDPQKYAGEALQAGMDMTGMAPLGLTVWHGSPHKFSKFDMSKIGTGEGAQAYGHGLYTAEAPEVAQTYKFAGSGPMNAIQANEANFRLDGKRMTRAEVNKALEAESGTTANVADYFMDSLTSPAFGMPKRYSGKDKEKAWESLKGRIELDNPSLAQKDTGALYKVDIPDEAVARFLDWDKKLSEQAPEVQKAIKDYATLSGKEHYIPKGQSAPVFIGEGVSGDTAGREFYKWLGDSPAAASDLKAFGIPGIRYLDGGSRSTGQGSSNFVLFDDQLPRILEINGQPTGQIPWKPGEWRGLLAP